MHHTFGAPDCVGTAHLRRGDDSDTVGASKHSRQRLHEGSSVHDAINAGDEAETSTCSDFCRLLQPHASRDDKLQGLVGCYQFVAIDNRRANSGDRATLELCAHCGVLTTVVHCLPNFSECRNTQRDIAIQTAAAVVLDNIVKTSPSAAEYVAIRHGTAVVEPLCQRYQRAAVELQPAPTIAAFGDSSRSPTADVTDHQRAIVAFLVPSIHFLCALAISHQGTQDAIREHAVAAPDLTSAMLSTVRRSTATAYRVADLAGIPGVTADGVISGALRWLYTCVPGDAAAQAATAARGDLLTDIAACLSSRSRVIQTLACNTIIAVTKGSATLQDAFHAHGATQAAVALVAATVNGAGHGAKDAEPDGVTDAALNCLNALCSNNASVRDACVALLDRSLVQCFPLLLVHHNDVVRTRALVLASSLLHAQTSKCKDAQAVSPNDALVPVTICSFASPHLHCRDSICC